MNHFLFALLFILAAQGSVWSDEIVPISGRSLDLEFAAAAEGWVVQAARGGVPEPYRSLVDRLDADRYMDRSAAGAKLLKACTADPTALRWLMRGLAVERRPEARYWLNRILRQLNRCETCDGAGYCTEYRPTTPATEPAGYIGSPCRRCGRPEWNHGWQWIEGTRYGYLACSSCYGSGTHWNHYAVD
jgi:hypothetical protein